MVVGVLAAPGLAHDLADQLADELPELLRQRHPEEGDWQVEVAVEGRIAAPGADVDVIKVARDRMLRKGWDLVVGISDLPLFVGRHPVTVTASTSLGVGVISVPALGAVDLENRVR